ITPEHVYLNRRKFMVGVGSVAGVLALAACAGPGASQGGGAAAAAVAQASGAQAPAELPAALSNAEPYASAATDELGDYLEADGGCDHDTGICSCEVAGIVSYLEHLLGLVDGPCFPFGAGAGICRKIPINLQGVPAASEGGQLHR
ncbi:hypothetical protein LCGC14_2966970, partial [marine sediment metagenome]